MGSMGLAVRSLSREKSGPRPNTLKPSLFSSLSRFFLEKRELFTNRDCYVSLSDFFRERKNYFVVPIQLSRSQIFLGERDEDVSANIF